MIGWILHLWTTPSAYRTRPWSYALNQVGHGYVIGGLPAFLWGPDVLLPLVILYALIVELPQVLFWRGQIADGIEDTAHVATVAVALAFGLWPALIAHALFVAAGMAARTTIGGSDED